jgi:hypothetical protein
VTDIPSKGLLHQLVEVLQALASSQDLLIQKVRSARLETSGLQSAPSPGSLVPAAWDADASRAQTPERSTLNLRLVANHSAMISTETVQATPHLAMSSGVTSTHVDRGPSIVIVDQPDAMSSFDPPNEMSPPVEVDHVGFSTPPPNQTSGHEPLHRNVGDSQHTNRDYNFFDELDAKLADLTDDDSASDVT